MADNTGKLVRPKLWFDEGFTQVPNTWLRDKRLTYTARGLLTWLLSHSEGFEVTIISASAGTSHGVDAMRKAVSELEHAGYLKRYQRRIKGRICGTEWQLLDPFRPVDNPGLFERDLKALNPIKSKKGLVTPGVEKPDVVLPALVKPDAANPTTIEEQLIEHLTNDVKNVTIDGPVDNSVPNGPPTKPQIVCPTRPGRGHEYEASGYCRHCAASQRWNDAQVPA